MDISLLHTIILTITGFIIGSIPFSVVLTKMISAQDPRSVGDHNPGATNALIAGGLKVGIIVLILDVLKGFVPVAVGIYVLELNTYELILPSVSPILGHAFSPFLKFKGGKAIAASFGVWSALTLWRIPILWGLGNCIGILIQKNTGKAVVIGMLIVLLYLVIADEAPYLIITWVLNLLIVSIKMVEQLKKPFNLRFIRN